jgi:hypothetical protein
MSFLARFGIALLLRTPLIYPDEYLYAALSRSLGHGRFDELRGGHFSLRTTAYLGPLLMAPAWLLTGVGVAYRLCQALGSMAFAAAVFPAYALARRLGITTRGSIAAAALAVAVPSGVFTTMLLSEPYTYPLFLLAVLAAVEAIAAPTVMRQVGAILLGLGLCVAGGLQFLYFVPACIAAFLFAGASSVRGFLWRAVLAVAVTAYLVHAVLVRGLVSLDYSVTTLASWFAVNLFAFAIGAGWVIVPGGFAGLWKLVRGADPRGRAFGLLTVVLLGAMLFEATVWSASGQGIYERFAFYGAPLLVIALVWAVESRALARREVAAFAYLCAVGAALLPVLPPLHGAYDEHSPTIHFLARFDLYGHPAALVWGPVLVVLALLVAWRGASAGWSVIVSGGVVCVAISAGASVAYLRHQPDSDVPRAHAAPGSALVTWQDADPYSVMKALFWNPAITRVVVLGEPSSPDGLPFTAASLGPGRTLTSSSGGAVPGPFVFAPDTTVLGVRGGDGAGQFTNVRSMPVVVALGWYKDSKYLATVGRIFAAGAGPPKIVVAHLYSPNKTTKTISFRCDNGFRSSVVVPPSGVRARVPVARGDSRSCWFGITRGATERVGRFNLSVKGSLALAGPRAAESARRG